MTMQNSSPGPRPTDGVTRIDDKVLRVTHWPTVRPPKAIDGPTEEERVALCEWLTGNGIDPKSVPLASSFCIVDGPDVQRLIHYTEYVLTGDGKKQVDPEDPDSEWTRPASAPCTVDPPAWLGVEGGKH